MGEATQQLVTAIMMDDCLTHRRAEAGHSIRQPLWHLPAMQRKIWSFQAKSRARKKRVLVDAYEAGQIAGRRFEVRASIETATAT